MAEGFLTRMLPPPLHRATVHHRGAALNVETYGEGAPVLVIHGGLSHIATMTPVILALAHTRRVIAFDCRGMGKSNLGDAPLRYAQLAEDSFAVLDALGVARCAIVGFSDGGVTGLRMAAAEPDRVNALVTIGSRWRIEDTAHIWEAFGMASRAGMANSPFAPILADYDRLSPDQDFDRLGAQSIAMWRDTGETGYPGERVKTITAPVLVATGDRDPIMPPARCLALHEALCTSEFLVLPRAAHAAYLEQPALFNRALVDFLERAGNGEVT